MKSVAKLSLIILFACVIGCSDKQKEDADSIARHEVAAQTYLKQGQIKAAILEARNIIQLSPDDAKGYVILAQIYNDLGASAANYAFLEPIIEKMPEVSTELAIAYLHGKKYRSALNVIAQYPAATQEDKVRQAKTAALSSIYLGENNEADNFIATLGELKAGESDIAFVLATAALSKGNTDDAFTLLDNALKKDEKNIELLTLIGSINAYKREFERAESNFTMVLGELPKTDIQTKQRLNILTLLTEVLIQQGRTSEAYTYQKIIAESNAEGTAAQQRFNEAMELYQQGNLEGAETILRELREQFPNDKNSATLLGMVEFQKGDDEKASTLFDSFIDPETANPTVIQAAALVKFRNNQMAEALVLLKAAAENQPNNPAILATYGLALLDQDEKSAEGAMALEKSLALNPKQQRIRIALAKRYMALEQNEQAIAQLQKAYQEQPLDLIIQQSYFKSLFDNDLAEKVKEEVASFKQKNPGNPRGDFIEGWYNVEQKNYPEAEKAFERAAAVKDSPEQSLALSGLAQVYEMQKQPQKAIVTWQLAIESAPQTTAAYGRWLALARNLKRESEAFEFLRQLEKKTTAWQPSLLLSQLELQRNNITQSIAHIEEALARSNSANNIKQIAARLFQAQGVILRKDGKIPEARASFLRAVKFYPESADFLNNLIEVEIAANNLPEAQKLLDQFVKTDENEAERLFLQGNIRIAEKNVDEALKLYRTGWEIKPMEAIGEAIYGIYQRGEKTDLMVAFGKEWAEKIPASYRPALINAINAQSSQNADEALKWYEKAVELAPQMPAALNNLAWMYYERKDERALDLAKRAYELAPDNAAILDTYGWILVEGGQVEAGLSILERAAALAPDNKEILDHLKQAKAR